MTHVAKRVDPKLRKIALLLLARMGVLSHIINRSVDFRDEVVVQFLVGSSKAPGLMSRPGHAEPLERLTKGGLSSRGSAMLIRLSAMNDAGNSGLSSAARHVAAVNRIICPC